MNKLLYFFISVLVVFVHSYKDGFALAPMGVNAVNEATQALVHDQKRDTYMFRYKNGDDYVEYMIYLREASVRRGLLTMRTAMEGRYRTVPIDEGGFILQSGSEKILPVSAVADNEVKLVTYAASADKLSFHYEEQFNGYTLNKSYTFQLKGRSLQITGRGESPQSATTYYTGFDVGPSKYVAAPAIFHLPSNPFPFYSDRERYFHSVYLDPSASTFNRYGFNEEQVHSTSVRVSNTPAFAEIKPGEKPPAQEFTLYVTSSPDFMDVIPPPSAVRKSSPPMRSMAAGLHPISLTPWPYKPTTLLRRWVSPKSGTVQVKGAFELRGPHQAVIDVELLRNGEAAGQTLFTQVLEPGGKQKTGINGEFMMREGDQLIIHVDSPAVLDDAQVSSRVVLTQGREIYDSIKDFSPKQGYRGWHYEQRVGNERLPLKWNQGEHRWESEYNNSWQTVQKLAIANASDGEPFSGTSKFFDELDALGMKEMTFLLKGWNSAVKESPEPFKTLVAGEKERGNVLASSIGLTDFLPRWGEAFAVDATPTISAQLDAFARILRDVSEEIDSNGVLVNPSALAGMFRRIMDTPLRGESHERTERRLNTYLQSALSILTMGGERDLFLESGQSQPRFAFMLSHLAKGMIPPFYPERPEAKVVEEDLIFGRESSRIGYGSTGQMKPNDPRFVPVDAQMAATSAYGRVPYIDGNIWNSSLTAREIRQWYLQHYAMLKPVSEEYMDTQNGVKSISYIDDEGDLEEENTITDAKQMMLQDTFDRYDRLKVDYENGLSLYINRGGEPWFVEPAGLENSRITRNGFLALNSNSALKVFTGTLSGTRVQLAESASSFFLNARDGVFTQYDEYGTDGMMYLYQSPFQDKVNISGLGVTDISRARTFDPIIRSNTKMDISVRWQSPDEICAWIIDSDKGGALLELFNMPQDWLSKGNLVVHLNREGKPDSDIENYSFVESATGKGLRLPDVKAGDEYLIRYQPQVSGS